MSRKLLLLTVLFCLLWPAHGTAGSKPKGFAWKWTGLWYMNGKRGGPTRGPWHRAPYKGPLPGPSIPKTRPPALRREPPVKPLGGNDEYRAGVAAMARLDYRMAMKLFQVIIARYRGLYAGRAKSRLREIGRLARQKMALYEQLWGQGREEEAIRVLAEVAEKFDGSETATTAKSKLVQFAQTPGLAEMVSKARAEAAASFRERLRRRLLRAAESDVPEQEAAPTEQEAVAAEQDTLEVGEPGAQEKCNRLLSLAANYRLNRHLEAARAAYKEIIDLYPEDESAGKAEEELRAVEKEMEKAEY